MSRKVLPPDPSVESIDTFMGMVRDRSGEKQNKREFRTLKNVDNVFLQSLKKRLGTAKYGGLTDAGGAKVQAGFDYISPAGVSVPVKISGGLIKKFTAGTPNTWTDIGTNVFTDAVTWFAQMGAIKTGASADATGTLSAVDYTTLTDAAATLTVNAHVGKILSVSNQKKVISSNNATKAFLAERFDDLPTGAYSIYPSQQELFIANGTNFYKCDPAAATPALTQLDNSTFALAFTGICTHGDRLWGWKGNRLYWSDLGNGENFSRNAWKSTLTDVQVAADLGEVLVSYEKKRVMVKFNASPDQFLWKTAIVGYGCCAPKSIGTHPAGIQFFLDDALGVMILNLSELTANDEEVPPVSVSQNFMNTMILAHTAAELAAAVGYCDGTNYYLHIGDNVYVLHVAASLEARKEYGGIVWIWSYRTYPAAQRPNAIFKYGTALCFGGGTNGQVYEVNKATTYTDDGTAIDYEIEKADWNPDGQKSDKSYDALQVDQDASAAACTRSTFFAPGGTTYDAEADQTAELSTATADAREEIKIPSNPSRTGGKKDSGRKISFKITESGSVAMPDIEGLELHYFPGIVS